MKPWKETWTPTIWTHDSTCEQRPYWCIRVGKSDPFCEFEADEEARARLAAEAPVMARLLLSLIDCDDDTTTSYIDDGDRRLIRAVLLIAGVTEQTSEGEK